VAFSPDGAHILTGSQDGKARIFDAVTGKQLVTISHKKAISTAIYSPNGYLILTACEDKTVQISEASNGRLITQLHGHDKKVISAAFSSDSNKLITGSEDHTARIWNIWAPKLNDAVSSIQGSLDRTICTYLSPHTTEVPTWMYLPFPSLIFKCMPAGQSLAHHIIESGDYENVRWIAQKATRILLAPMKFTTFEIPCTAFEYFIRKKRTSICVYLVQVYSELLWPPDALVKSQRDLSEELAPQYDQCLPLCDLVLVKDLVLLGNTYPALLLQLVHKLVPLSHHKRLVDEWLNPIKHFEVEGSTECYPFGFWNPRMSQNLPSNMIKVAVEAAILPIRDVASLEYDFLGTVFRAAKGDPQPFESEFLQVLVDFKWRTYVRKVFVRDFMLYALMTCAYVAHSIWFVTYSGLPYENIEKNLGILLYTLVLVLHLYFVMHEVKQFRHELHRSLKKRAKLFAIIMTHLRDPWNLQDMLRLTLVSLAMVYYFMLLLNSSNGQVDSFDLRWVSTLSAFTIPWFALGFLFYLQAAKGYGALVQMVFKIIQSTKSFLAVLVILIFGFSASFNLITSTDYSSEFIDNTSWNTYANSLLNSTLLMMGVDVVIDAITESHYALVAVTLLVSFVFLMAVILLNLLIAIMSDKHDEVKKQEKCSANYNRAGIVVEYEKLMSAEERKKPEYSPAYLQVLRPEKVVDDINDSGKEIRALEQLLHDKADELKEQFQVDLEENTKELNKSMDITIEQILEECQVSRDMQTNELKDKIDEAFVMRDFSDNNSDDNTSQGQAMETLKENIIGAIGEIKEENTRIQLEMKEEITCLRNLLENQMQSTSELKDMLSRLSVDTQSSNKK
jgi:hypothetical protein